MEKTNEQNPPFSVDKKLQSYPTLQPMKLMLPRSSSSTHEQTPVYTQKRTDDYMNTCMF